MYYSHFDLQLLESFGPANTQVQPVAANTSVATSDNKKIKIICVRTMTQQAPLFRAKLTLDSPAPNPGFEQNWAKGVPKTMYIVANTSVFGRTEGDKVTQLSLAPRKREIENILFCFVLFID